MNAICRYLDVSFLTDEAVFQKCLAALPWKERQEKAVSFRHENGRILSLGASLLLKQVLEEAGVTDFSLVYESSGKPALSSGELQVSLSHSGAMAVCAASRLPVGVDVEPIRPMRFRKVMRYFHPAEASYIENAEDEDMAFTRIWTRKESYGKRTGTGIAYDMKQFCFLDTAADISCSFHECSADGYLITVCTDPKETVLFHKAVIL